MQEFIAPNTMLSAPLSGLKNILLPRFDTIGDIILMEGLLRRLMDAFPSAEFTIVVRDGYEQELKPLFNFSRLIWKTHPFNAYTPLKGANEDELISFLNSLSKEHWDLVLFTTYNRTLLEDMIAAHLQGVPKIGIGKAPEHDQTQLAFLRAFGLDGKTMLDQMVLVDERGSELAKYAALLGALSLGNKGADLIPHLVPSSSAIEQSQDILRTKGFSTLDYFVCMPAGLMTIKIKAWPSANFAAVSKWAAQELHIQPLVVGHVSEKEIVERTVDQMRAAGVEPHIWLGQGGDLQVLAALLKTARFYVGNDSAPMHLSAAVGTPTVGIFGGGHWPRFLPAGEKAIGVAAPLPCFYCSWDCIFGDAPCVRLVSVKDVIRAINIVLSDGPETHGNMLLASITADPATSELVEKSKGVVQQLRADLRLCREVIDSLKEQISKESAEHLEIVTKIDNSLSWRVTRPLRLLGRVFRKRR